MITPIRTMKINDICQRKDDLLMSADDIEEIAKNVRAKAIDEFVKRLKEVEQIATKCTLSQSDGYSQIMRICDEIAEQMKGK